MRPALFVHCLSFSDRSIISKFIPIWPSTISNIFNMDDDNQYLHWNRFWTVLICNILSMRTLLKTLACNSIFWLKYSICFIQLFLVGWSSVSGNGHNHPILRSIEVTLLPPSSAGSTANPLIFHPISSPCDCDVLQHGLFKCLCILKSKSSQSLVWFIQLVKQPGLILHPQSHVFILISMIRPISSNQYFQKSLIGWLTLHPCN